MHSNLGRRRHLEWLARTDLRLILKLRDKQPGPFDDRRGKRSHIDLLLRDHYPFRCDLYALKYRRNPNSQLVLSL